MKKRISVLLLALLLSLVLCLPAAAGTDYGKVYDETDLLASDALTRLGEEILPASAEEMDLYLQVDVLTDWAEGDISGDAALLYEKYSYGFGEDRRGLTLTLGVRVDGETVTLGADDWYVYVGGTDAKLTNSTLASDVTAAVAPYLAPAVWDADPAMALARAVNAMACAAANTYLGTPDAPITDLTGGLLGGAEEPAGEPAADGGMNCLFDVADVLGYPDWEALDRQARTLSERYRCGVYAAIVDDYTAYGSGDVEDVAGQLYVNSDLGYGEKFDGILLLLSLSERDYALYAFGDLGGTAFNSYARGQLEEAFLPSFGDDDWAGGIAAYLGEAEVLLAQAESGSPAKESPVKGILTAVGISCVISLIICLVLKGKMKSVRKGTAAHEYVAPGSVHITDGYERFTHTTETRRTIEKDHGSSGSGGSSGGSSSSGKF